MVTGHGYLDRLPLVLGVGARESRSSRCSSPCSTRLGAGRPARSRRGRSRVLAPLAFALQEIIELSLHTGTFAWHGVAAPTFLPGIALQLPFSLLAWLAARLLLRAAGRAGRALAAPPPGRTPPLSLAVLAPAAAPLPRPRVLAYRLAKRGPPLSVGV